MHPECKRGEMFLGNTTAGRIAPHLAGLKTIRLGEQSYDLDGKKLPPERHRPLIIHESESGAYDRIMMARFRAIGRGGTSDHG